MNKTIKYIAFNTTTYEVYACTSKSQLAIKIKTSVDTIRRKQQVHSTFIINDWCISTDVVVHKIDRKNNRFR